MRIDEIARTIVEERYGIPAEHEQIREMTTNMVREIAQRAIELSRPTLTPIDLTKGDKHEHPDLLPDGTQYVVKFLGDPAYYLGTFSRQWYGLNFNNWGVSGRQFDAPGTNSSRWEAAWRLDP